MRHRATISLLVLALCAPVSAAVPLEAPLQGTLRDNAGMPVMDGAFAVTFSLYAGAEDADAVWTESWASATGDCVADPTGCVMVSGGRFHVRLGAHAPLDAGLFATHGALWLGVSVEGEPELPRRPLGSTPYARHAATADGLLCSGCVDLAHLAPGVVEALAASEITADDLPGDGLDEVSGGMLSTEFENTFAAAAAVPIKDYYPPGVTSTITVGDVGIAKSLSVSVAITNSDLSLLTVTLTDPQGAEYSLWAETGPGEAINATYPAPDATLTGDLTTWFGQNAAGDWTLEVVDHSFNDVETDGEIGSWSVVIDTQSNQRAAVKGDLVVEGDVSLAGVLAIGDAEVACSAGSAGTVRYDEEAARLYLCTGSEWLQLRACSEHCPTPAQISCGQNVTNDCGALCSGPGTGVNQQQCGDAVASVPCGEAVTDSCGNACGTTGSGLNAASCAAASEVACGEAVMDGCGNPCGVTGTYCEDGSPCTAGTCNTTTLIPGNTDVVVEHEGHRVRCMEWSGDVCLQAEIMVLSSKCSTYNHAGQWHINVYGNDSENRNCPNFCALATSGESTEYTHCSPGSGQVPGSYRSCAMSTDTECHPDRYTWMTSYPNQSGKLHIYLGDCYPSYPRLQLSCAGW